MSVMVLAGGVHGARPERASNKLMDSDVDSLVDRPCAFKGLDGYFVHELRGPQPSVEAKSFTYSRGQKKVYIHRSVVRNG